MASTNRSDSPPENLLQDYSLVISVTMLATTTIFGSGVSGFIFIAILVSKSARKLRHALFTSLLFANVIFGFIWVPIEIVQLFQYKLYDYTCYSVKHAGHALYIFIVSVIACTIFSISIQSILVLLSRKYRLNRRKIVLVGLPGSWICGVLLVVLYLAIVASHDNDGQLYHLLIHPTSFQMKLSVFTIFVVSLIIMLIVTVLRIRMKDCGPSDCVDLSGTSTSDVPNETSICLPTIEEPTADDIIDDKPDIADTDNVSLNKQERSVSPCVKPKKEENNVVGIIPPKNKDRKNSLTINFGNMLNRRRHTICQIGDTGPQFSPVERANQYNYVRKFSVDVMALQAQLENPKIFNSDLAFHSQQELNTNEADNSSIRKSGTSLASIREDEDNVEAEEIPSDTAQSVDPGMNDITEHLTRKQSAAFRHLQLRIGIVKYAAFMILTFLVTILPVYITETLQSNINRMSYINVITYTTAFSTLQVVVYPQFILCMEHHIKDATRNLVQQIRQRLTGQPKHEIRVTGPDDEPVPCNNTTC